MCPERLKHKMYLEEEEVGEVLEWVAQGSCGEALEWVAQGSCECSITGGFQGQAGQSLG